MKVLVVHNFYQIPGGEDTVVYNEKKLLESYGHEVILYTRNNSEITKMFFRKLLMPGIAVFNIRTYLDIKKIIKTKHVDIVHVHNTLGLISQSVYYAAVKCKVPVIQTIHNFRFLCPGATFYRDGHICEDCVNKGMTCAIKNKCYRDSRIQTAICVFSTWFHRQTGILKKINYITLTEFNREKLLHLKGKKKKKIFVKPNFTYMNKSENNQKKHRDYYLFVGRIEEIKGVTLLVNAFSRMREKRLMLAGNGPLLDSLKVSAPPNITFLGQINHDKILDLMKQAKAVILPSQTYEGFPMTIPETFSTYTPMIAGDIGNVGILIEQGKNGMKFKYDSEEALIATIEKFESTDRDCLGEGAYETFKSNYSEDANYRILEKIYRSILEE